MAYVSKKQESSEHVPYRPEMNMQQVSRFDAHLRNVPGSWTMTRSFLHAGDPRVVSLRWIIPGERWSDEAGFLDFLALRDHQHRLGAAQAVRQDERAAHQLISFAGIDAQPHSQLNCLVKFCEGNLFEYLDRLFQAVLAVVLNFLSRGAIFFPVLFHSKTSEVPARFSICDL